jgi:hypothetical protein
MGGYSIN